MVGAVSDWLVSRRRDTLLGVAVAEAASLHYQVVDGEVSGGEGAVGGGGGGEVFGLAGTRLVLQEPNADVGHPQLLLALQAERVQGLPLRQRPEDHLSAETRDCVEFGLHT